MTRDAPLPPLPPDLPALPPRRRDSHKGDFGRALVVGGSRGMTGAIALAGLAALRGGSGLVHLAVPSSCLPIVAAIEPSYMTIPLAEDAEGRLDAAAADEIKRRRAPSATAVALGPGLGRSPGLTTLVVDLYGSLAQPMVVDADALNALADRQQALTEPGGPRILTPHPGEFRRLVPAAVGADRRDQESLAAQLAASVQGVVVLKGHGTMVTDGSRTFHNRTGNPGMATGGTGDVLTGLITALVCQGLGPYEAAVLGVFVHGLAGDLAAAHLGQMALIARDLVDFLAPALCHACSGGNATE